MNAQAISLTLFSFATSGTYCGKTLLITCSTTAQSVGALCGFFGGSSSPVQSTCLRGYSLTGSLSNSSAFPSAEPVPGPG